MTTTTLDNLCAINPETLNGATPDNFEFRYLDISAVTKGTIDWAATRDTKLADAPSRARRRLRAGDALLCTVRPALQAHARITSESPQPLVGSTGFAALRPYSPSDASFVFHQLFSNEVAAQLRAMETGSSYPAVNESDVHRLCFYCPKPEERWRIAAVLDTVDEAIGKTEQVIAKLKQVRAGLLHDLLTRGLDEHGQLRDPLAHPEQFQDSPLGRVPQDWNPVTIADVVSRHRQGILTGPFGADLGAGDFVRDGVPVLQVGNVQAGYIETSGLKFVSELKAIELQKYRVQEGDILFARSGATTGRNTLADAAVSGWLINYHIIRVSVDREGCHPAYLFACLNSDLLQRQVHQAKGKGTREGINTEAISLFQFALPPRPEQDAIVAALSATDDVIVEEHQHHAKLSVIKSGLMTDLLTGRVPVPADLLDKITSSAVTVRSSSVP